MRVHCHSSFADLVGHAATWNRLARGVPFRGWEWQSNWWKHFGSPDRELLVLAVHDDADTLVGLAPFFAEQSAWSGRTLRFLGVDEVCSDYLGILATTEHADAVAQTLARWLIDVNQPRRRAADSNHPLTKFSRWDLLQLSGVAESDRATATLIATLVAAGNHEHHRVEANTWRLDLPPTWEKYEDLLSKSHRKQMRRAKRDWLDAGRAVLHVAASQEEVEFGMHALEDLHERRRRQLGQTGCFDNPTFRAFLMDVSRDLFRAGNLRLSWLTADGEIVAAEFQLVDQNATYAYQSGIAPERLECEPGRLITLATMRLTIDQGLPVFDFLRGDEPYKPHWRAEPKPLIEYRVAAQHASARIRDGIWTALDRVKRAVKRSVHHQGIH